MILIEESTPAQQSKRRLLDTLLLEITAVVEIASYQ
jgi:hypothetical protein